jgi:anti-anti-sigma regulatory factor
MPIPFRVRPQGPDHPVSLVLVGELDQAGVAELEAMVRWVRTVHGQAKLVLDISALEFCDSAGWHALERCRAAGATISGSPPCMRRLFYLIKHAHLLPTDMHELRGLERAADQPVPLHTAEAA